MFFKGGHSETWGFTGCFCSLLVRGASGKVTAAGDWVRSAVALMRRRSTRHCVINTDCSSVSLHSADERFDASFHTNILVNSTGYCQYLPPGNTAPLLSAPLLRAAIIISICAERSDHNHWSVTSHQAPGAHFLLCTKQPRPSLRQTDSMFLLTDRKKFM